MPSVDAYGLDEISIALTRRQPSLRSNAHCTTPCSRLLSGWPTLQRWTLPAEAHASQSPTFSELRGLLRVQSDASPLLLPLLPSSFSDRSSFVRTYFKALDSDGRPTVGILVVLSEPLLRC